MSFQPPKGTDDITAPESQAWRRLFREWETWTERYGYPLVMTPVFEATELFERGVGETTEVVTKQMYTFTDKGGRSVTLRPEATAGVVRAFLNSGARGPWKAAYSGPMFRYERPQAGRRRQFWQLDAEYLDVESPASDVEILELGYRFLVAVGVPDLEVRLNSLGDEVCRPGFVEELRGYLRSHETDLCDDSKGLIETNPLRVLDCKVCAPRLLDAPAMVEHLCSPCADHYSQVKDMLKGIDVPFVEDPKLVRGLDYYTRTAFEYIATSLAAAQNAVGGGGRYDGLAEAIGGRRAPGVGFALGVDRIILASVATEHAVIDVYVVSETGPADALAVASTLRARGIRADFDPVGRAVKTQFKSASKSGAAAVIVIHGADLPLDVRFGEERIELPLEQTVEWIEARR